MKIAIIGTGGVGGYFGGKFAAAGHDVAFVARGRHLEAIRERGLKVASISGDILIERANATDDIKSIGRVDLVILGVKAWQVREVAGQVLALVGERTIVLPLQNGVAAARELAEALDERCIVGGLCRFGWCNCLLRLPRDRSGGGGSGAEQPHLDRFQYSQGCRGFGRCHRRRARDSVEQSVELELSEKAGDGGSIETS